jgi:hypothetical protein
MVPAADGRSASITRCAVQKYHRTDDRNLRSREKNKSMIEGTFIGSLNLPAVRYWTHDNR